MMPFSSDPEQILDELKEIAAEIGLDVDPAIIEEITEETLLEDIGIGEIESEDFMDAVNLRLASPMLDKVFETWEAFGDVIDTIMGVSGDDL